LDLSKQDLKTNEHLEPMPEESNNLTLSVTLHHYLSLLSNPSDTFSFHTDSHPVLVIWQELPFLCF